VEVTTSVFLEDALKNIGVTFALTSEPVELSLDSVTHANLPVGGGHLGVNVGVDTA
jgi:hypothetical protein